MICECGCGQTTSIIKKSNAARGWVKGKSTRFVLGHHARVNHGMTGRNHSPETRAKIGLANTGERSPNYGKRGADTNGWRGGRHLDRAGYVNIYVGSHPMAKANGYVLEHRLVMAKSLGIAALQGEWVVHHKNRVRDDNRVENLVCFASNVLHMQWHALLEGGESHS